MCNKKSCGNRINHTCCGCQGCGNETNNGCRQTVEKVLDDILEDSTFQLKRIANVQEDSCDCGCGCGCGGGCNNNGCNNNGCNNGCGCHCGNFWPVFCQR